MNEASKSLSRRYWPLGQLVLARLREFLREPEAVFWVYGFPILMTVGLGIAFKNRPIEEISLVIVEGPSAKATQDALTSSKTSERFEVEIVAADEARRLLRTGRTALVVDSGKKTSSGSQTNEKPEYVYQFDPTRADSGVVVNPIWLLTTTWIVPPDRKSTRLNSSHTATSRMPSSA